MTSGRQLHLLLLRVARRVIGVDIDTTNLETMRKAGLTDLIEWDVEKLDQLDVPGPIDVIIAGDIVEHLSNPGMAMSAMHAQMKRLSCRAIITVPNAFSLKHFLPLALLRKELVMPDHVCYYSLTTLRGLLSRSNLRIVETAMYSTADRIPSTGRRLIQTFADKTVLRFAPQLADGIIVVVEAA
jgi:2-polyprenyl-3-methyl-5-hydroxy-6-metoxy-1,4-benzoquinol methylase